jgi:hypothetical protein
MREHTPIHAHTLACTSNSTELEKLKKCLHFVLQTRTHPMFEQYLNAAYVGTPPATFEPFVL